MIKECSDVTEHARLLDVHPIFQPKARLCSIRDVIVKKVLSEVGSSAHTRVVVRFPSSVSERMVNWDFKREPSFSSRSFLWVNRRSVKALYTRSSRAK